MNSQTPPTRVNKTRSPFNFKNLHTLHPRSWLLTERVIQLEKLALRYFEICVFLAKHTLGAVKLQKAKECALAALKTRGDANFNKIESTHTS